MADSGNEFVRIRNMEESQKMAHNIKIILTKLYDLEEDNVEIKKTQRLIREEMRNIGKLRALRKDE